MKKFFLGFLALASVATANAQNPKTAITNAAMSLEIYNTDQSKTEDLIKAKNDIDFAAGHEKTEGDSKVWKYRGQIYTSIAFNSKLQTEHKNAGIEALKSYTKSWELEAAKLKEKGKDIAKISGKNDFKAGFENTCRALYNGGAAAYNAADYQLAYESFTGILTIKPLTDKGLVKKPVNLITKSNINMEQESARLGGMAAIQLGKPKEAEDLLMPLLEGKKIAEELIPTTYSMLASGFQKADMLPKAKEILGKARKIYPTNQSLLIAEINIALSEGKLSELEGKLKQAVEGDKDNVELHFVLGNVYDGIFREKLEAGEADMAKDFFGKAVDWYKKGSEIDPKHFNSAYSLGALHVNYSNSFAKQLNDMEDYKSQAYKDMDANYNQLLDSGLAYLLDAEEIKGDDLGVAVALREVYCRKNDEANCTKYGAKVKELQK